MISASPTASHVLDRVLVLEMVRVTEAAAIAAAKLVGRGDEKAADAAAVEAMRAGLNELPVLAIAEQGCLLNAPDVYMEKLAVSPGYPEGTIDLAKGPGENIRA